MLRTRWIAAALLVPMLLAPIALAASAKPKARVRFFDAASQGVEFIGYSRSIALTPEQQKVRAQALENIPAPCCSKFSAETCCCPCNLAKSVWGLSHYLIAKKGAGAAEVSANVRDWIAFASASPKGPSGTTCDTAGGCARPISQDGCGGMNERDMTAVR
jgi:hypothetical protein